MLKRLIEKLIGEGATRFIAKSLTGADGQPSAQRMAAVTAVWTGIGITVYSLGWMGADGLSLLVAWLGFAAAALGFAYMGSTKYWNSGNGKDKEGGNG